MNRDQLALLSDAHAVAYAAVGATENGHVPYRAAQSLVEVTAHDPELGAECRQFLHQINMAHGDLDKVAEAGRKFRDAVCRLMEFRPVDFWRVDIHG